MLDDDVSGRLAAWTEPFERLVPPDLTVIRNRARRRAIRRGAAAAIAVAAAGTAAALIAALLPPPHHLVVPPAVKSSSPAPGVKASALAPFYIAIPGGSPHYADVRNTTAAQFAGALSAPAGDNFVGVAAAGSPRSFVFAVSTGRGGSGPIRFYRLRLASSGPPGRLRPTRVPPLTISTDPHCTGHLAGLAVTPDGRTLAASTLSDCANGHAGPSRIEIASLTSGRVLRTINPGHDYPVSLSWTDHGDLVYDWGQAVWTIRGAAAPGQGVRKPALLIAGNGGLGGFSGPSNSLVTPDGSLVLATVAKPDGTTETVAEFSVRTGQALRILLPPSRNPSFCGALWASAGAQHVLAACGGGTQASVDDGHITRLHARWQIPFAAVPGAPQIAW